MDLSQEAAVDVSESHAVVLDEHEEKLPSYEAAAKAACAWVEQGKTKVNLSELEVYPRSALSCSHSAHFLKLV